MKYVLIALLLAGCATQKAERDIANYAPYCEKLGYQQATDQWRQCIQTQSAATIAASQGAVRVMER